MSLSCVHGSLDWQRGYGTERTRSEKGDDGELAVRGVLESLTDNRMLGRSLWLYDSHDYPDLVAFGWKKVYPIEVRNIFSARKQRGVEWLDPILSKKWFQVDFPLRARPIVRWDSEKGMPVKELETIRLTNRNPEIRPIYVSTLPFHLTPKALKTIETSPLFNGRVVWAGHPLIPPQFYKESVEWECLGRTMGTLTLGLRNVIRREELSTSDYPFGRVFE